MFNPVTARPVDEEFKVETGGVPGGGDEPTAINRRSQFPEGRQKLNRQYDINLVAGASVSFDPQLNVDWWLVSIDKTANASILAFLSAMIGESSTVGIRLKEGGRFCVPGEGSVLTIQNIGAVTVLGTAIALAGYEARAYYQMTN